MHCTRRVASRRSSIAASFLLASSFAASPRHTVRISASRDANHRAKRKRRISGGHVGPLRRGARHLQLQGEQVTFFSRFSSPSCCRILFKIKFYLCAFVIECCYIYVRIIEYTLQLNPFHLLSFICHARQIFVSFAFPFRYSYGFYIYIFYYYYYFSSATMIKLSESSTAYRADFRTRMTISCSCKLDSCV